MILRQGIPVWFATIHVVTCIIAICSTLFFINDVMDDCHNCFNQKAFAIMAASFMIYVATGLYGCFI